MSSIINRYLMVGLGCLICGASINAFFMPNKMLSGGVSGVSMILYFVFNLPMSITSILLNIPLFFYAYRLMDRGYVLVSLYGMFVFSFSLDAFRFLADLQLTNDMLLAALCGGMGNGLGAALMYRVNGGSGGTDIIGGILNKYYGLSIGSVSFAINSVIMGFNIFLFGLTPAMYTFIGIYFTSYVANRLTAGFDFKKSIIIISPEYKKIADDIVGEIGRGVTYLYGEGAFTGQKKSIIFVVIKLTQIAKIKALVYKHDPQAFMIVQEATDVMGKGFTIKSDKQIQEEMQAVKKKRRLLNISRIHKERVQQEKRARTKKGNTFE